MIDVAKVADLVLLMVDANFGFEMEIFEFLNIAQVLDLAIFTVFVLILTNEIIGYTITRHITCQ